MKTRSGEYGFLKFSSIQEKQGEKWEGANRHECKLKSMNCLRHSGVILQQNKKGQGNLYIERRRMGDKTHVRMLNFEVFQV